MGKGKGKKSRVENTKKKKDPKIKGLPSTRPPNPTKVANKRAHKQKKAARLEELKEAIRKDPSLIKPFATPMQRTAPFMKNPNAAKWPALFKRQLGLIEMHIDSLTRVMNAMRSDGDSMSAEDKLDWELGERGNWRAICGMMDRARLVLSQTKEAAQGVLPEDRLRDKKKLGVVGTEFEPLVPKLDEKARAMGYDPRGKGALGRSMDFLDRDGKSLDQDGDTDMSDASDSSSDESDSDNGDSGGADFISLDVGSRKKQKRETANGVANENGTEPSAFFVVDTEPTPINLPTANTASSQPRDGLSNRKRKQMEKDQAAAERLAKRMAKKAAYEAEKAAAARANEEPAKEPSPGVDFRELEAKLQAEIDNGTKAQQEAEAKEAAAAEKTAKKKRRRSSEGGEEVVKKAKKDKKESEKKEKKEKKKRKADDVDEEDDSGKKKKRKHRDSDSE